MARTWLRVTLASLGVLALAAWSGGTAAAPHGGPETPPRPDRSRLRPPPRRRGAGRGHGARRLPSAAALPRSDPRPGGGAEAEEPDDPDHDQRGADEGVPPARPEAPPEDRHRRAEPGRDDGEVATGEAPPPAHRGAPGP